MTFAACPPFAAAAMFGAVAFVAATVRPAAAQQQSDFAALLADAGVDLEVLASLADAGGELTTEQLNVVDQVLFRLDQFERGQIAGAEAARLGDSEEKIQPHAGELLRMEGVVTGQSEISRQAGAEAAALWRYELELSPHEVVTVISAHAPRLWSRRPSLHEPVQVICVWAGFPASRPTRPVVLVNRLRWYPTTDVPTGVAWLAANGFDAALLDDVRPVSGFGKPHESRENEAFYAGLAAVRRGDAADLRRLANEEVVGSVKRWREKASTTPAVDGTPSREARIAAAVERSARRGVSSVGPMYLAPAETMGRLVLIEGVARRAVRVAVDDETDGGDLEEYYELDLFTPDSENLPVICCAVSLPAGFPTGDRINEPLRVAGVFLKRWAYLGRPDTADGEGPERIAAPLVLAAEPQWLRSAEATPDGRRGLWIGIAFVGALALIWLAVALTARSDRLARLRRTGYDAEPGVSLGPPPADK
jgi:hypothetical protein